MKLRIRKNLIIGYEFPIYLMLLGMMFIQIATPLYKTAFVSLGTWIIVFSSLFAFVMALYFKKMNNNDLLFIIILCISILLSVLLSSEFSYSSIISAGCFLEVPIFLGSYTQLDKNKIRNFIYLCFVLLSIYYILLSLSPFSNIYYTDYDSVQLSSLTLGYSNPNETAIYLMICAIVIFSLLMQVKNIILKIVVFVDLLSVFYLIWLAASRTIIIISIFLIVCVIIFYKRRIPYWFRTMSFCISYIFIIATLFFYDFFTSIQLMGDSLETGRFSIYETVLEGMDAIKFLFGDFSFGFNNLHNGFWCVFATIGSFGVLTFFIFLNYKIKNVQYNTEKNIGTDKIALIGLFCIIISTATEAALISAGSTFAASTISVYLLSISKIESGQYESVTNKHSLS